MTSTVGATQQGLDKILTAASSEITLIIIICIVFALCLIPLILLGMKSDEFLLMLAVILVSWLFFTLVLFGIYKNSMDPSEAKGFITWIWDGVKSVWAWIWSLILKK